MKRIGDVEPVTPFVAECWRIAKARSAAKTQAEKEDAEWALTFLFQMHKAGRLEEYFAGRQERD